MAVPYTTEARAAEIRRAAAEAARFEEEVEWHARALDHCPHLAKNLLSENTRLRIEFRIAVSEAEQERADWMQQLNVADDEVRGLKEENRQLREQLDRVQMSSGVNHGGS